MRDALWLLATPARALLGAASTRSRGCHVFGGPGPRVHVSILADTSPCGPWAHSMGLPSRKDVHSGRTGRSGAPGSRCSCPHISGPPWTPLAQAAGRHGGVS